MFRNSKAVILLGPPGSGKTTIGSYLAAHEDLSMIKAGKLLKDEMKKRTWWGDQLKLYLDNQLFPPARIVKEVIAQSVEWSSSEIIVFEGFPRSMDEINSFFEIEIREELILSAVIVLKLSLETSLERLSSRLVCKSCGSVFNLVHFPPQRRKVCDICGKSLHQLKDDSPEKIRNRIEYFRKHTVPVIDHFKKHYSKKTFFLDGEKKVFELSEPVLTIIRRGSYGDNENCCNRNSRY
ncbi:MAG: nucleoside monophosphate kinase [Candidatus Omnitrophota bacterium]